MSKQKLMISKRITSLGYVMINEMVNHLISKCSKLAQKEYNKRHGNDPLGIRFIYLMLNQPLRVI